MNTKACKNILRRIVELLCNESYEAIIVRDFERRVTPQELQTVILQFGGKITMPPADAFDRMDVYRVNNRDEVKVDFDLWIDNTESELTLLVRIIDLDSVPKYAIEDLRVL